MLTSAPSTHPGVPRWVLYVIQCLCVIAVGVSTYLAWTTLTGSKVAGCSGDIVDCASVLKTKYSAWFGIPVSVFAINLYAAIFGATWFCRKTGDSSRRLQQHAWAFVTLCGLSAGLAALYFIGLQIFSIGKYCVFCLGVHTCSLILAGLVVWHSRDFGWRRFSGVASMAALGLCVLIGGQALSEPPQTHVEIRFDDDDQSGDEQSEEFVPPAFAPPGEVAVANNDVFAPPGGEDVFAPPGVAEDVFAPPAVAVDESSNQSDVFSPPDVDAPVDTSAVEQPKQFVPVSVPGKKSGLPLLTLLLVVGFLLPTLQPAGQTHAADGQPAAKVKAAPRLIPFPGNVTKLDVRHWPMIGKQDARYVFIEMFDYTCQHCRKTHTAIKGACTKLNNDVAIIALPVPLASGCNKGVQKPGNPGACELARLAIAVWRVKPDSYKEYHNWAMNGPTAPNTFAARQKAEQLVGKPQLDKELALGIADKYIAKHVELYQRIGSGAIPKIMFPKMSMVGAMESSDHLVNTIKRELK